MRFALHALGIVTVFVLVGLTAPPPGVAALAGICAFMWAVWLVAALVRHLTRKTPGSQ